MILFVRHGQTVVNREARLQGRSDARLTELGQQQAKSLAAAIGAVKVSRVVSSPLGRARETADAIAAAQSLPVEIDDRLLELDYGDWDRRPIADFSRADWDAWRANPDWAPPGGESLVEVTKRVASFCEVVPTDDIVVAVSHVSPIKAAVCLALAVDERASWRMHLNLASITRIGRRAETGVYLASYNETSHLD